MLKGIWFCCALDWLKYFYTQQKWQTIVCYMSLLISFLRFGLNTRHNLNHNLTFSSLLRSLPAPIGTECAVTVRSSMSAAECQIFTWGLYNLSQLIRNTAFLSRLADRDTTILFTLQIMNVSCRITENHSTQSHSLAVISAPSLLAVKCSRGMLYECYIFSFNKKKASQKKQLTSQG